MNFSREELVDMIYVLGESERNAFLASRVYAEKYPHRTHPDRKSFERLKERFERTGRVDYEKHERIKPATNDENKFMVMLSLVEDPHKSTRKLGNEFPFSASSASRIIRSEKLHPYHIQLLQELEEQDYERRVVFCQWSQDMIQHQAQFFDYVLFSDEATFHNNGFVNRHNFHYYDTSNPFFTREVKNQHRWSINVWAGIIGNHVIGPYFFEGNVTGQIYLDFLQNDLPGLLNVLPEYTRETMWFQQDGAPPHYSMLVRNFLNQQFNDHWIGRGGPISWPARSPDLTKLDFFLWGYVKERVNQTAPTTRENMQARIREVFQTITPTMLRNVSESFEKRTRACILNLGGHIEHNL